MRRVITLNNLIDMCLTCLDRIEEQWNNDGEADDVRVYAELVLYVTAAQSSSQSLRNTRGDWAGDGMCRALERCQKLANELPTNAQPAKASLTEMRELLNSAGDKAREITSINK